jgi:hypothetical protein
MGICSTILKPSNKDEKYRSICTYPRVCTVNIKKKLNRTSSDQYDFHLTEPTQLKTEEVVVDSIHYIISQCILPGIDPRGQFFKKCQDNCLVLYSSCSIFLGLFDGHGREGLKVVNFCCFFAEKFFLSQWDPSVLST